MKLNYTLSLLLTFLAAQMAGAATITVTSTADSGPGTLRDALATAADGDTIDATGVFGTILLTSGELLVSASVTILGPGAATLAVDGTGSDRVFHIQYGTVSISGLTITHGAAGLGGGIFNEYGTLTVSNCTISANSAQGRGGGVENYGPLNVVNSTISGNLAGSEGGGIDNIGIGQARVRIKNSTISSNQAGDAGGGIAHYANGSSVYLTVFNCTFSGNIVTNGSGDGIWMYGQTGLGSAFMEIGSTILIADPSRTSLYTQGNQVSVQSDGYNLSSDWGGYYLFSTGDQLNTDPLLGPLQDNGGPTLTHALLPGSPAIDKGKNLSGSATDQRGLTRPYDNPGIPNAAGGDGTDIGAFEVQAIVLQLTAPAWDGNGGFQFGFNTASGMDYTIQISTDLKNWAPALTFEGPGGPVTIIDPNATSNGRRFYRVSLSLP